MKSFTPWPVGMLLVFFPLIACPHKSVPVTNSFEFRPGVIVDPDRSVAYLMNPDRGIDAVDLSTGKLIWRSGDGAKPLILFGDRLACQAEPAGMGDHLTLVILDAQDGGRKVLEGKMPVPPGLRVSIDDGMGTFFQLRASLAGEDLVVSWKSGAQQIPGADGGDGQAPYRESSGGFRLDPESGETSPLDLEDLAALRRPRLPENVAALVEAEGLREPPRPAGKVLALAQRKSRGAGEEVLLRRWDRETGKPLPDVTLFRDGEHFAYPSADGRHLLATRAAGPSGKEWVWSIHSAETGALVAEVRNDPPAAWFFLLGSTVIHEVSPKGRRVDGKLIVDPPHLRAIDLKSGKELWMWPYRDTAYRGSYPPGPSGR